jgi:hypothetical protein
MTAKRGQGIVRLDRFICSYKSLLIKFFLVPTDTHFLTKTYKSLYSK